MKIVLGKAESHEVKIDLDLLLRTRLLVQASSGGGKSWLLRRLAEELFGKVQVIIIDPEGEFASLRERFDYVLVGKGGETPADVRSAALVAHKLLELHVSAVCDIFEMKPADRHRWVRLFLDAMIDAPKTLWHPVVVIIDEAHVYAPEKSAGESEASEAVISLATRGRKRGFCAVLATQRLGKLRKDAAAELGNVLIGPTNIDIDVARAAEALGIAKPDMLAFKTQMRTLGTGRFWAFGRAITTIKTLVTVGPVLTTHPEIGGSKKAAEPPPAPEKIKALLPKLADLPRAAEEKAKTEAELRAEIRGLKAELSKKPVPAAPPAPKRVEVPVLKPKERATLERAAKGLEVIAEKLRSGAWMVASIENAARDLRAAAFGPPRAALNSTHGAGLATPLQRQNPASAAAGRDGVEIPTRQAFSAGTTRRAAIVPAGGKPALSENGRLGKAERSILAVLAQRPEGCNVGCLALLAGYTYSGGFRNSLAFLRTGGLIQGGNQEQMRITEAGYAALGEFDPLPEGRDLQRYWLGHRAFGKSEREALRVLIESYPESLPGPDLAKRAGYEWSGGFRNALSALRTAGVIRGSNTTGVSASSELFS